MFKALTAKFKEQAVKRVTEVGSIGRNESAFKTHMGYIRD